MNTVKRFGPGKFPDRTAITYPEMAGFLNGKAENPGAGYEAETAKSLLVDMAHLSKPDDSDGNKLTLMGVLLEARVNLLESMESNSEVKAQIGFLRYLQDLIKNTVNLHFKH